ncbi:MAG: adenylosuccinate synthetase, partial [Halobacteria archaeon]|nr:adenylosuccinate synthetase [Halobacteria archaeon]
CTAYDLDGERLKHMPADMDDWARCEPVYEEFDGWEADWDSVDDFDDIPENARDYLRYIEDEVATEIYGVSVGPAREQTIILTDPFEKV